MKKDNDPCKKCQEENLKIITASINHLENSVLKQLDTLVYTLTDLITALKNKKEE